MGKEGSPLATRWEGRVLVLRLERPERRNALDDCLLAALGEAFEEAVAARPAAAVITGSDGTFSAGADLGHLERLLAEGGAEAAYRFVRRVQSTFARVEEAPFPTIAAIEGPALGGGLELALACDLRVAGRGARLGFPEIGLGAFPAAGGTTRLAALIGSGRARALLLDGRPVDGDEAERLGLVNRVTADGEALRVAISWAEQLGSHPGVAIEAVKRLTRPAAVRDANEARELEARTFAQLSLSGPWRERVAAFLERRRARGNDEVGGS